MRVQPETTWNVDVVESDAGWAFEPENKDGKNAYASEFIARENTPYAPGDVIWVRETWRPSTDMGMGDKHKTGVEYRAGGYKLFDRPLDGEAFDPQITGFDSKVWASPMHMPRWACRLFLRVVSVRPERLHEISFRELAGEGIPVSEGDYMIEAFAALWDSMYKNSENKWDANPWVWRIEFERIDNYDNQS